ncbi:MAG: hypothetical protein H0Z18_00655 [Thermococcus sp.]|uniref:hypothetical protein n=1 Tax=Thermococcus sp. TaxID=35749 RepID=UPI001DC2E89B|nr:hypothetical protein [Thermococcus sp.]MBO8173746.1 hypothetical protein [Thermococcus sp.]
MPIATPPTIPIPRKRWEGILKESTRKKKLKKEEFRLVYVRIETKNDKTVGESAKELEIRFKEFSPARLIEPDETNLLLAVEKFLKNNPPRIYVVELTDRISRWFYVFPSAEKIKFEKKSSYRVFVVKKKDAVKEILERIASGEFSKKFKLDFLTILQILIGFAPFVIAYIAGEKSLQNLFNYLLWAVAIISAIQGIKKGYKEKSWEE